MSQKGPTMTLSKALTSWWVAPRVIAVYAFSPPASVLTV